MKHIALLSLFVFLPSVTYAQAAKSPEDLLKDLQSPDTTLRIAARKALLKLGPEAIPAFTGALKSDSSWVRSIAIHCLGRMGEKAGSAVPTLVPMLDHKDATTVLYVKTALGRMGEPAVAALIPQATSEDLQKRLRAIIIIGENRTRAAEAAPVLAKALKDPEVKLRAQAAIAMAKLGPAAASETPALLEAVADKSSKVWRPAYEGIFTLGDKSLPHFLDGLSHKNASVRFCSARVLGAYGKRSTFAVPKLVSCLKDKNKDVRRFACTALGKIGAKKELVIPALIEYQCSEPWSEAKTIRHALLKFGPAIVPATLKKLEATGTKFSNRLLANLSPLGPRAKEALPLVTRWLKESKASPDCLRVLTAIGPSAEVAIPVILPRLVDKQSHIRRAALGCLANIGDDALALGLPAYTRNIHELDKSELDAAMEAIAGLGKRAKPAYRDLRVIFLTHPDKYTRKQAKKAMDSIAKALKDS